MDLDLLERFLICLLTIRSDSSLEPTPTFKKIMANYRVNPRAELAHGLTQFAKFMFEKSQPETDLLCIGLILGVLATHTMASGWDGQNAIKQMVDATFNEKTKRKNLLPRSQAEAILEQRDLLKGVNDWLEKYKGGTDGTA